MRKLAWFLIISSILAMIAELFLLKLPSISWAFNTAHETSFLHTKIEGKDFPFAWFGYVVGIIGVLAGVLLLRSNPKGSTLLPTTIRRIARFKANKRGYVSLWIILFMVFLAGLDQLLVGKKALFISCNGKTYCPAFMRANVNGEDVGLTGDKAKSEVHYREFKASLEKDNKEGTVIMPLVPFDPAKDSVKMPFVKLEKKDGLLLDEKGEPMNGRVSTLYDEDSERRHITYEYRKGIAKGGVRGLDRDGVPIYEAKYRDGTLVAGSEKYTGQEMSKEEFLNSGDGVLTRVFFHAAPPMQAHLLGTTPNAEDVLAYLYGGLQVNIRAILIYIPAIYIIGVSIGLMMGYFGGTFDLVVQRIIEIFSTIPFLFIVIIFSSMVPSEIRGLGLILLILIAFGWMGMTYLMRTAAMKEKARDYIAAAQVSGATTQRVLFSHILPNTVAILVTLIPFSVSSIIMSLTALDYLGFGLPPEYATWGTLLKDGLANYSKPWLVASAFTVLVSMLILITFVGEAVRDAFDPKKFSTYK